MKGARGPRLVAGVLKTVALLVLVGGVLAGVAITLGLGATTGGPGAFVGVGVLVGAVVSAAVVGFYGYVLDLLVQIRDGNDVLAEKALGRTKASV